MIEGYVPVDKDGYPEICPEEEATWQRLELRHGKHRDLLKEDGWRVVKVREVEEK